MRLKSNNLFAVLKSDLFLAVVTEFIFVVDVVDVVDVVAVAVEVNIVNGVVYKLLGV